MTIRTPTLADCNAIQRIYLSAFPKSENKLVSKLAIDLLLEKTTPQIKSFVAETNGTIIGHIAFSPVLIDNAENFQGYILAPLGVKPEYQKGGIGSKLIEYGMNKLSVMGVKILFVYGDPNYYGRFGFSSDAAIKYRTPYELKYPFGWQAIILNDYIFDAELVKITCVKSLSNPSLW